MPSPLPSSTDTVLSKPLVTARSRSAVAVEIPSHQGLRGTPGREVLRDALERAVAVAQEHRDASAGHRDGQVEPAVAVEVARHDAPVR